MLNILFQNAPPVPSGEGIGGTNYDDVGMDISDCEVGIYLRFNTNYHTLLLYFKYILLDI